MVLQEPTEGWRPTVACVTNLQLYEQCPNKHAQTRLHSNWKHISSAFEERVKLWMCRTALSIVTWWRCRVAEVCFDREQSIFTDARGRVLFCYLSHGLFRDSSSPACQVSCACTKKSEQEGSSKNHQESSRIIPFLTYIHNIYIYIIGALETNSSGAKTTHRNKPFLCHVFFSECVPKGSVL